MPNSDNIDPLSLSQQKFLQLLLASHVMTDSQCQKLYKEICSEAPDDSQEGDSDGDDDYDMGDNMEDCIGTINKSLEPAFGLEIRTIAMTIVNNNAGQRNKTIRYHAVCNRISGTSLDTWVGCHKSPHEIAYLRVLLEHIAEKEHLENQHSSQSQRKPRGVGCTGKLTKIDCLNHRADLEAVHRSKFNLHDAERALLEFEREGWLVVAAPDDDDDDDSEDDEDEEEEERSRKRTKSSSTSSNSKNKSSSRKAYQIGPRSYCELSNFLKEILLGGHDSLPQFIHHG